MPTRLKAGVRWRGWCVFGTSPQREVHWKTRSDSVQLCTVFVQFRDRMRSRWNVKLPHFGGRWRRADLPFDAKAEWSQDVAWHLSRKRDSFQVQKGCARKWLFQGRFSESAAQPWLHWDMTARPPKGKSTAFLKEMNWITGTQCQEVLYCDCVTQISIILVFSKREHSEKGNNV